MINSLQILELFAEAQSLASCATRSDGPGFSYLHFRTANEPITDEWMRAEAARLRALEAERIRGRAAMQRHESVMITRQKAARKSVLRAYAREYYHDVRRARDIERLGIDEYRRRQREARQRQRQRKARANG